MNINKNNNSGIVSRIAKSNLQGSQGHSIFAVLTIVLAVTLITGLSLIQRGSETETERILDSMQHVMYMGVSEQQMEQILRDPRVELLLPYKLGEESKNNDIAITPVYFESCTEGIFTYAPTEGRVPETKEEIVVDKKLMPLLGKEAKLGEEIELDVSGSEKETFQVSGYVDSENQVGGYSVYFSKEYADTGATLRDISYTALVRIANVEEMTAPEFTAEAYDIASDYGVGRMDVNINGMFEASLQVNAGSLVMILVSLLVMFACAIVIYSMFYLSITGRVQQIGQLQTIGMTQKQIKSMVTREGLLLSSVGIPFGIAAGGLIGYITKPKGWSAGNFLQVAVPTILFGVVTIMVSIRKPAELAAAVSPVEAARYSSGSQDDKDFSQPHKMLTPYTLAKMERRGNRKKNGLITVSLAIEGILLMTGAAYLNSWSEEQYARQYYFEDCEFRVMYHYSAESNPEFYGITNLQRTGALSDGLKEEIAALPYVKSVDPVKYTMANVNFQGNDFAMVVYPVKDKELLELRLKMTEDADAGDLKDDEMVIVGTSGLKTSFALKEPIRAGETVEMRWFNGTENRKEMKIAGISEKNSMEHGLDSGIYLSERLIHQLWPDMNKTAELKVSIADYEKNGDAAERKLNEILSQHPDLWLSTLREQRLMAENEIRSMTLQIYGISIIIISFSILNMINTTLGTIAARKKEFAMLESIGMEGRQILKMLTMEGIRNAVPNILITFFAGTCTGYAAIAILRMFDASYLKFRFPLAVFLLYAVCMLLAPPMISFVCIRKQNKVSLVERLRRVD